MEKMIRLKKMILLRKLLKRTIPNFSHLEQKELNGYWIVRILNFQDPQSSYQLDYDEMRDPKTRKCYYQG